MPYDFPNAPTTGQAYQGYVWDGEKWVAQGGPMGAVRYDLAQGLSSAQMSQGRANIGIASYTVAALPAGTAGAMVFATNCRVFNGAGVQEGAGAGTGGLVTYNGTAWKIAGTNITAVA